jgi:hypothetical protein
MATPIVLLSSLTACISSLSLGTHCGPAGFPTGNGAGPRSDVPTGWDLRWWWCTHASLWDYVVRQQGDRWLTGGDWNGPDSMSQRCGIGGGGGCALVRGCMAVGKIEHEIEGRTAE